MKKTAQRKEYLDIDPYPTAGMSITFALFSTLYQLWPGSGISILTLFTYRWFLYSLGIIFGILNMQTIIVYATCIWLDKKMGWETRILRRVIVQFLLGWVGAVSLAMLVSWFAFAYFNADVKSIRYAYNSYMLKSSSYTAAILNFLYLLFPLLFYYDKRTRLENEEKTETPVEETPLQPQVIPLPYAEFIHLETSGEKEKLRVCVADIAYIHLSNKNSLIVKQFDGTTTVCWNKLDELQGQLNPGLFRRVNRYYILNHKAVVKWKLLRNRNLMLTLNTPQSGELIKISREKVKDFLAWIENESDVAGYAQQN